jgi:hypothetical protein
MDVVIDRPGARLATALLILSLGLAACAASTASQELSSDKAPTPAPAGSIDSGGGGGGGTGEATATGSLVSSGLYDATWTWVAGNAVGPGLGGITVNSDKGTFGNIEVLSDGSISFSTGDPAISAGAPYKGTGAQVKMTGPIPCGFTLDNDLTGSDGKVLHLKGEMAVVGGAFQC